MNRAFAALSGIVEVRTNDVVAGDVAAGGAGGSVVEVVAGMATTGGGGGSVVVAATATATAVVMTGTAAMTAATDGFGCGASGAAAMEDAWFCDAEGATFSPPHSASSVIFRSFASTATRRAASIPASHERMLHSRAWSLRGFARGLAPRFGVRSMRFLRLTREVLED